MPRHLILRLEAPLIAFGAEAVDNYGVIRDFPARSMLTGMIANALGYRRGEARPHERLQERLVFAARLDRVGGHIRDFQTVALEAGDRAWTRAGHPEGRAGRAGTYKGPHLRYRDYLADACICVALALDPAAEAPALSDVAVALDAPARPLFIGRKSCLPAARFLEGEVDAETALDAVRHFPMLSNEPHHQIPVFWSGDAQTIVQAERIQATTRRNWKSDVHVGVETVYRAMIPAPAASDESRTAPTGSGEDR